MLAAVSAQIGTQTRQAVPDDSHAKVDWRFTTADARIKLKRLYPQTQP